jgi:hypothetical protein
MKLARMVVAIGNAAQSGYVELEALIARQTVLLTERDALMAEQAARGLGP